MAEVRLKDVAKIFPGGVEAVRDFTLDIPDGRFVVLVGPSGCGKSTTLRMIAGLEEITRGTITIGDRVVNDVPPADRDIAMVFQNYALYPHMTVYQNMAFGLKLRKMPKSEIAERIRETAELLGITELLGRRPKALSGGQRQRVAVGRAIVRKPAVFLFDEPLSNLDAKLRTHMRVELKRLHADLGATMVYVTHDQIEAMTMGDSIVVMNDGVIQQVAEPVALYDDPANRFVAGFIGTPPTNFFEGRMADAGEPVFTAEGGVSLAAPEKMRDALAAYAGKGVSLGVRPDDVGSPAAERCEGAPRIRATVEVVEPLGAESHVHFKVGPTQFISRVEGHRRFGPGDEADVAVLIEKAHFYDPETGARID